MGTLLAGAAPLGAAGDRATVEFALRRHNKEQKQIDSKVLLIVFEINCKSTERLDHGYWRTT